MIYRKYQPCKKLAHLIECYFIWDSEGNMDASMIVESPPSGFCSVVFNYGDTYFLQNKKYENLHVPMQFLAGQSIYSYKLFLQGNIGITGIVFKPAALATLFRLPMYEYVEERVDLYNIFPKENVDKYSLHIREAGNEKARVQFLEEFTLHHVNILKPECDFIDEAANFIVEHNGMVQVSDLIKESCMSRRTFERRFF